jgi:hypothetical protein
MNPEMPTLYRRIPICSALALVAMACFPTAPIRAETYDYFAAFHWSGRAEYDRAARAVATEGDVAYLLLTNSLQILDLTVHATPPLLGQMPLPGVPSDIAARQGVVFIACQGVGLLIVDVADPGNPTLLMQVPLPEQAVQVVLDGSRAYVREFSPFVVNRMDVYDISDPASPALLGTFEPGWRMVSVSVRSDRVYATADDGSMRILDFTDPESPQLLSQTYVDLHVEGISVDDRYAYVGFYNDIIFPRPYGGLAQYDTSSPQTPQLADSLHFGLYPPTAFALEDTLAYVVCADEPYPASYVYDVRHPGGMYRLAEVWQSVSGPVDVATFAGGVCFAGADATVEGALEVFRGQDYSDQVLGEFLELDAGPWDMDVIGNHVYLPDYAGGVRVMDVTDPRHPATIEVALLEDYPLSIAAGSNRIYGGLSNRLHGGVLQPSGHIIWCGSSWNYPVADCLTLEGNRLYLARRFDRLFILDTSIPCGPIQLGSFPLATFPRAMDAQGSYLYMAANATLVILDVSNPSAPVIAGSLAVDGVPYAESITVSGTLALLGLWNRELWLVDVSDPAHPASLSRLPLPNGSFGIAVEGTLAYVGCNYGRGVYAVDIADPANPTIVGGLEVGNREGSYWMGEARTALTPSAVALADRSQGLMMLPKHGLPPSSVEATGPASSRALRLAGRNPTPGSARVRLDLDRPGPVRLVVLDIGGRVIRRLADRWMPAGSHEIVWNGRDDRGRRAPSGVYLVRLAAGDGETSREETIRSVLVE